MTGDEITTTLAELIATCKRSEADFTRAASCAQQQDRKNLLVRYASQRAKLAGELGQALRRLGGNAEFVGQPAPANDQTDNENEFIVQCRQDEDAAKEQFEEALREDLPLNIRMLVQRQYSEIKSAREQLAHWEGDGGKIDPSKTTSTAAWRSLPPTVRRFSQNR